MSVDAEEATRLCRVYFAKYGLTLRGLQLHHGVDEEDYLSQVHDTLSYRTNAFPIFGLWLTYDYRSASAVARTRQDAGELESEEMDFH